MFTDTEATPTRVETLVDLVRSMSGKVLDKKVVRQLLQPPGLPGLTPNSDQASAIISAARELELIEESADGAIRLTRARDGRSARRAVVEAIDEKVLLKDDIEPWFAMFYAYLLGQDESAAVGTTAGKGWESRFQRDFFGDEKATNRFNADKYRGLRRWFRYCGLGWHDAQDCFHPNPYERLSRQLTAIFEKDRQLPIDLFLERLSQRCPELDGGHIFLKANPQWDKSARTLSLGLSHALVDLHLDGKLVLECPLDSDGWSIAKAAPPRDSSHLKSDRVAAVHRAPATRGAEHG